MHQRRVDRAAAARGQQTSRDTLKAIMGSDGPRPTPPLARRGAAAAAARATPPVEDQRNEGQMRASVEAELWDMTHRRREDLRQLGRHRLAASNARMPQRRADREQPLHGERVRLVVRGACALSAPRGRRACSQREGVKGEPALNYSPCNAVPKHGSGLLANLAESPVISRTPAHSRAISRNLAQSRLLSHLSGGSRRVPSPSPAGSAMRGMRRGEATWRWWGGRGLRRRRRPRRAQPLPCA